MSRIRTDRKTQAVTLHQSRNEGNANFSNTNITHYYMIVLLLSWKFPWHIQHYYVILCFTFWKPLDSFFFFWGEKLAHYKQRSWLISQIITISFCIFSNIMTVVVCIFLRWFVYFAFIFTSCKHIIYCTWYYFMYLQIYTASAKKTGNKEDFVNIGSLVCEITDEKEKWMNKSLMVDTVECEITFRALTSP